MPLLRHLVEKPGVYLDSADIETYGHLYAYIDDQHRVVVSTLSGKEFLHRVLLPDVVLIDHRNNNPTDNRRANLRVATKSQNAANSKVRITSKSGYKGVSYRKAARRYVARVHCEGKEHHLGLYSTAEGAARAYNAKALELFGSFAKLNTGV